MLLNPRIVIQPCLVAFRLTALCGCVLFPAIAFSAASSDIRSPLNDEPAVKSILDSTNGVGAWIWDSSTFDKQTCRLWRSFEIPHSTVASAKLRITVDNGYRLYLDGWEIGRGSDWRTVTEYDLTWVLNSGRHILAVEAFNDGREAGLIMGLRIELVDQRVLEIASDESWRVIPNNQKGWEHSNQPGPEWRHAIVVGAVGSHPWESWPLPPMTQLSVQFPIVHFWQSGWFQIALLATCGTMVLICFQLMTRLAAQSRAQRLLQLERARIARDIHDDLGARLTQLVLLGEVARSELPAASEARAQVDGLCDKARDLSHAMDEVVWAVNSRRDTLRDFASYVCKYAQLFLASTPIRCRLDVEPDLPPAPFDLPPRRNLFLAVKEALNNAAKYSEANEVFLRIHRRNRALSVVVEDNGKGFDPATLDWERNGLTNMIQRMNEVGGQCQVTSAVGCGCCVELTVPLAVASRLSKWFHRQTDSANEPVRPDNAQPISTKPEAESATSRTG